MIFFTQMNRILIHRVGALPGIRLTSSDTGEVVHSKYTQILAVFNLAFNLF